MQVKHHAIILGTNSPSGQWYQCWHGLSRLRECELGNVWHKFMKEQDEAHKLGYLGEAELEVDIFLSIIGNIKSPNAMFIELGAGYGEWCLAFNGVIRNRLVDTLVESVRCYAIEAEPQHIAWAEKHFRHWCIKGEIVPFVISDRNGHCKFAIAENPGTTYGQGVTYSDDLIRTAYNILRRKSILVTSITLDSLVKTYHINHIDLIDMDVQGNEVRVANGAMESIKEGLIDYWKIGTHRRKHNDKRGEMLSPHYDLVVDVYPNSVGGVDGLLAKVDDGIQVYQRKGLWG